MIHTRSRTPAPATCRMAEMSELKLQMTQPHKEAETYLLAVPQKEAHGLHGRAACSSLCILFLNRMVSPHNLRWCHGSAPCLVQCSTSKPWLQISTSAIVQRLQITNSCRGKDPGQDQTPVLDQLYIIQMLPTPEGEEIAARATKHLCHG